MVPRGLDPRTLWLLAVRSNQLSYETLDVQLDVILRWDIISFVECRRHFIINI